MLIVYKLKSNIPLLIQEKESKKKSNLSRTLKSPKPLSKIFDKKHERVSTPKGKSRLQIKDRPLSHKSDLLNKTAKQSDKKLKIIKNIKDDKKEKEKKEKEKKEKEEKIKKEKEEKQKILEQKKKEREEKIKADKIRNAVSDKIRNGISVNLLYFIRPCSLQCHQEEQEPFQPFHRPGTGMCRQRGDRRRRT